MIFDPRGVAQAPHKEPAPRVASLQGLRLAILDNTKWNGRRVLERTAALLAEQTPFASVTRYTKESFSVNADEPLIARIAAESDIALVGIGD